jgi:branched-chain amino acid transport system permease protein
VTGSPFGYTLRAARDHAVRCQAVGVDVRSHQLLAFGVAGLFAGLAGGIFSFLKGSVFPDYLSLPVSVESLVMVLLGGSHTLAGGPVGAAVYKVLDALVTKHTDYWQAVLGGILVLLVMAFPHGLLGFLAGREARVRRG